MEREQIKKALECIARKGDVLCEGCSYRKYDGLACHRIGAENALALITSQEQRIKELTTENVQFRHEQKKLGLLIDELEKEKRELFEENKKLTKKVESYRQELGEVRVALAEANKERQELTEELQKLKKVKYIFSTVDYCADDLAKALEENKKLTEENEAWQKSLITQKENADKAYYELACEVENLRAENARYEAENHAEFNKWLKLEEATKRHHSELFEEAKIAVKEDTVREMRERLIAEFRKDGRMNYYIRMTLDQIAKEMSESANG